MKKPCRALLISLFAVLVGAAGCAKDAARAIVGPGDPPPASNSPSAALRLLEWSYNHRAAAEYSELFTADYRFVFSVQDTNGNAYRDVPFARGDELISASHLFAGGDASQPAASTVNLIFDRDFILTADPRAGKDSTVHKAIRSTVVLAIIFTDGNQTEIRGSARFYLVRGDSASIPSELLSRGFEADSGRWYVERWEDETLLGPVAGLPVGPSRSMDLRPVSWGGLKARYR